MFLEEIAIKSTFATRQNSAALLCLRSQYDNYVKFQVLKVLYDLSLSLEYARMSQYCKSCPSFTNSL